ncbi:CvpA family protein [Rubrimonas cliftonensis]|uniref:Membrane protein required for colicin V production n=1 Tax=Rubrimonas cliftonensis TaxID=89524 RepID=A0A1H3YTT7_9RHOB|nr:CvpA family protein [Rubrimonas cliftonensis]SEA14462.1 membrane protein required for colicin V production [Rubrimonas cliftonensis]
MAFTVVDLVVLGVVAVSGLLAYSRGLTREALAIGGWILAGLGAFFFAPLVEPLLREIPVVGDFLRTSCTLAMLAGFAVSFALILLLLAIFTPLVSGMVRESAIGPLDSAAGFLFGVARGVALVAVLYLLYDLVVPIEQRVEAIDGARSAVWLGDAAEAIRASAPETAPAWLTDRIDRLMGACGEPPATPAI